MSVAAPRRTGMTVNAVSLLTATVATNLIGVGFWAAASHLHDVADVGRASAEVSALLLLASIAQLNLNDVFLRFLPAAGARRRALVARSYLVVAALALVVGSVFVASGLGRGVLSPGLPSRLFFIASVALIAIFVLQDCVLTALRITWWVPIENVSFSLVKLALLPALAPLASGLGIVVAWVVPVAVAIVVVNVLLFRGVLGPHRRMEEARLPSSRRLASYVAGEYVAALFAIAVIQMMPLLVVWRLGPTANAYFTLPWFVWMGISLLLGNVAASFIVEVVTSPVRAGPALRKGVLLWGGVVGAALVGCCLAGPFLLRVAGGSYAAQGSALLRLIGLSTPFAAVTYLYAAFARLEQRVWRVAAVQAATGALLVGLTLILLPTLGLMAVGWANLVAQGITAGLTAPAVYARVRRVAGRPAGRFAVRLPRRSSPASWQPAAVGLAGAIVAELTLLAAPAGALTVIAVLILASVGIGGGVACFVETRDPFAQAAAAAVAGLASFALTATAMIWLRAWQPAVLVLLAAPSVVWCASVSGVGIAVRTGLRRRHARPSASTWLGAAGALRLAPLVLALAAWTVSMSHLRLSAAGLYGLLPIIGPWFYVALALLLAGFAAEVLRHRPSPRILVLYLVAILVAVHATVPLHSVAPEYAWVYKHIGVAEAFRVHGQVTDPQDIYQQWPGFFAVVAGVSAISGVTPLQFAKWVPLVFEVANCLLLLAVFRTLTRDPRIPFVATLVFACLVSWVGQDYLSPQAFAYLLWLGLTIVVLRWLRAPASADPPDGRIRRVRAWLLRGLPPSPASVDGGPRFMGSGRAAPVVIATGAFTVIVFAHQLTPFAALAGLAGLTVLDLVRPRWLVVALAAITFAFVLTGPRIHVISQYGGLLSGGSFFDNASGNVRSWHSRPEAFTAVVVRTLAVTMWVVTLGVIARSLRAPGRVIVPAVLAFAPFVILLGQSYGGEGIYRVYLFSAPWCAFLIATAAVRLRWPRVRRAAVVLLPAGVLLAGLQGLYGPVAVKMVDRDELDASAWFYRHALPGSVLITSVARFPDLQTANYRAFAVRVMPSDPLLEGEAWLNEGNQAAVDRWVASLGRRPAYLVVSRRMVLYARYYGFPFGIERLRAHLDASPRWRPVYRTREVVLYRFARPQARGRQ